MGYPCGSPKPFVKSAGSLYRMFLLRANIFAMSSSVSSQLVSRFWACRSGLTLFGTTVSPRCTCHRRHTCATDLPCLAAISLSAGSPRMFCCTSLSSHEYEAAPSGENPVTAMPASLQNVTRLSWARYGWISIWLTAGGYLHHESMSMSVWHVWFETPISRQRPISLRRSIAPHVSVRGTCTTCIFLSAGSADSGSGTHSGGYRFSNGTYLSEIGKWIK
mmetsp:Transcript_35139/g.91945  ORF Transcript_35139/g.91945 Transcript_35139/m.91945 type:complete len:219 (+) Transcript_35139:835-1491(+)